MGIYSTKSGLILGFHGCEREVRDKIVFGHEPMRHKDNAYDWLGFGDYFWEGNLARAWDFAQNPPGGKKYKEPAVLGAVIDLGLCLDLLETEHILLVRHSYNAAKAALENIEESKLPVNKNVAGSSDRLLRYLDCLVIETLHKLRSRAGNPQFDSVRGMFDEGKELYPGAGFKDKNHIQICIRNPNCIKGFFIPRNEVEWPSPTS
ncbi:hypothetical protein [Flaviaesturariibacter amylovorans]|uniref:Uncharacterized protein n=1 Tax=Flaviaesturariibacter amylovorans TaxID=1084520 RepID=A0ABP8HID5_9BACT